MASMTFECPYEDCGKEWHENYLNIMLPMLHRQDGETFTCASCGRTIRRRADRMDDENGETYSLRMWFEAVESEDDA